MQRTRFVGSLLPAFLVALTAAFTGCGGKFSSPEATFEVAKAAGTNSDWKGFFECVTPETLDQMTAMVVGFADVTRRFGALAAVSGGNAKEAKELTAKIDAIFERHGLTDEALKNARSAAGKADPTKVAAIVQNKPAFIGEMIELMRTKDKQAQDPAAVFAKATLKDVKINGDTATANIVDGDGKSESVNFRKVNGEWKLALTVGPPK